MADQLDLRQQVRTQEDGFASAVGFQQKLSHRDPRQRIERRSRLVKNQQLGIVDERLGQSDALLHAARELAHVAPGRQLKLELPKRIVGSLSQLRPAHAIERAVKAQQLPGRTVIERYVLRQKSYPRPRGCVAKRFCQQMARARRRAHEAEREVNGGRLPCPIRPEEAEDLSPLERESEAIECAYPPARPWNAIVLGHVLVIQHSSHSDRQKVWDRKHGPSDGGIGIADLQVRVPPLLILSSRTAFRP